MIESPPKKKLGQLAATAISGNDISSSCLYVSALAVLYSGQYAWIALLMVGAVLFLFRKIYGEVVGALPLNGGAYNALLNTTNKTVASLAATLTILSYMATAVISGNEAIHYAHILWIGLPIILGTIVLLALFMGLAIIGIGESAKVAIAIFLFHLTSLTLLAGFSIWYLLHNGFDTFTNNWHFPVRGGSITTALFFGFSAAMLGISGFESSANFVEEQQSGVFPKTLRNMWIVVTVFNPLMAFLALALLPIGTIEGNQDALLSYMGDFSGGHWLALLISVDAALVLSGAVLTSFVGVTGLVERMTLDRVLPQFLLVKNRRGTSYLIPVVFFLLCVSILLITSGELSALAGVYTIAFLSVMVLFGFGNILLKVRRAHLPRPERSSWPALILAIAAVITALVGNALLNPAYLGVFLEYFTPAILLVLVMLKRTSLLRLVLRVFHGGPGIQRQIDRINSQEFVYFTKGDDVEVLNKVMLYIQRNEQTYRIRIVEVQEPGEVVDPRFVSDIEVLDRAYPQIDIEFIEMSGIFAPPLIQELSKKWGIPVNFMFIASPSDHFPYKIEELGGVRLII